MLARTPDGIAHYLGALEQLAPLVAQHRATFDQDRRLPHVVCNALADAGLFRLWLPEALGGPELSAHEFMTVVEAASALDGSVGWLVGNGGGMSRVGGYLPRPRRATCSPTRVPSSPVARVRLASHRKSPEDIA